MSLISVTSLLQTVKSLDPVVQRKIAAVLGAAVGDAASRPLHWVYDNTKLQTYIKHVKDTPEFLPESKSPFYALPTGENSCYWDIAEVSLTTLAKSKSYNFEQLCENLLAAFSEGNSKGYDLEARQVYMEKRRNGQTIEGPVVGKWFHGAIIEFMSNYKNHKATLPYGGSKIKETDGFCLNLPFVCKMAGQANFDERSKEVIQILSTWPVAVEHGIAASRIVSNLIQDPSFDILSIKSELPDSLMSVKGSMDQIESVISEKVDHVKAVNYIFGSPCYNPGSFQGAIHATVTSGSFAEAVRKAICAGGCNCSRALFIGAMCGAKYGIDGIPLDWIERTTHAEAILRLSIQAYS